MLLVTTASGALVDPAQLLSGIYRNAYVKLLSRVAAKAQAGRSIRYDAAMARDVRGILGGLDEVTAKWAETVVPRLYAEGIKVAMAEWVSHGVQPPPIAAGFAQVHRAAVEALASNMTNQLKDATAFVGRRIEDSVRSMTLEAAAEKFATGGTLKQMRAGLIEDFADAGLSGIRDAAGREWRLDTYASMVARTTTAEAANTGTMVQIQGYGHDLVKMTQHRSSCPICAMYEGRVFSASGKTAGYPKLSDVPGFSDGYNNIHPNCIHGVTAYLPEWDKDAERTKAASNAPFEDRRSEADKRAYERSQEQNGLRRERRRLEEKVATLPKDSAEHEKAREKLREVRSEQQALGKETDAYKKQAAAENRAYYAARDAGKNPAFPGRQ